VFFAPDSKSCFFAERLSLPRQRIDSHENLRLFLACGALYNPARMLVKRFTIGVQLSELREHIQRIERENASLCARIETYAATRTPADYQSPAGSESVADPAQLFRLYAVPHVGARAASLALIKHPISANGGPTVNSWHMTIGSKSSERYPKPDTCVVRECTICR
jgi:hypothetical protein